MEKFNISREFFIKVFNLYCSLSFMTVLRKLKKDQHGQTGNQHQEAEDQNKALAPADLASPKSTLSSPEQTKKTAAFPGSGKKAGGA